MKKTTTSLINEISFHLISGGPPAGGRNLLAPNPEA